MKSGWQTKRLGEVIQKTETVNPLYFPKVEFNYIDVSSVSNTTFKIEETQLLTGKDAPSRARRKVKENDVIFATIRPTLRRIAIIPKYLDEQVCSTAYFVLRPKKEIDHRYIFYWLFSEEFMEKMAVLQKGASYPAVTDAEVKAQLIPIPPLQEQRRIVAILDEAFAGISAAKESAEKNLKNAKEVFEALLQDTFLNNDGWEEKPIKKIGVTQTGITPQTSDKENYGDYIPFIKPADIDFDGFGSINYSNFSLSEKGLLSGRLIPKNSVLMVCIGASIGKTGFSEQDVSCNQQINSLTLNSNFEPKFFYYALKTRLFFKEVILNSAQATLPIINKSKWENITVKYPKSVAEQRRIVSQFESITAETSRLESVYQQKLANLEELKKSILHKAFSGAL